MNSKIKTIALVLLISLINVGQWSNYDAPGVVAPLLHDKWNLSSTQLGQAYSFYSFPNLVIPLLYGALTDRVGPVWGLPFFFCLSQFFVTAGSVGVWLSNGNIPIFLAARTAMGLGGEYILLGQLAASSKWFPLNQQGIINALIMVIGMVALACLFNIFPMLATKGSIFFAFGVSAGAAAFSMALVLVYSVFHVRFSKRLLEEDKVEIVETGAEGKGVVVDMAPLGSPREEGDEGQTDEMAPASASASASGDAIISSPDGGENADERPSADVDTAERPSMDPDRDQTGLLNNESARPSMDDGASRVSMEKNVDGEGEIEVEVQKDDLPQPTSAAAKLSFGVDQTKRHWLRPVLLLWHKLCSFPALFWTLPIICGFNLGIVQCSIAFATDMLTTKWGIAEANAARISSVIVSAPIVVSIPFGIIVDKYGQRLTGYVTCGVLLVVSFVTLALIPGTTHWMIPAVLLAMQGIVFSYVPTAEGSAYTMCCPEGMLSTGMGISYQLNMLTTTVIPLMLGWLKDKTQSYTSGMFLLAGLSLFSLATAVTGVFLDRHRVKKYGKLSLQSSQVGAVAHHH